MKPYRIFQMFLLTVLFLFVFLEDIGRFTGEHDGGGWISEAVTVPFSPLTPRPVKPNTPVPAKPLTPVPLTVAKGWKIEVSGQTIDVPLKFLAPEKSDSPVVITSEKMMIPLDFFQKAFGFKLKGTTLTKGKQSIRLSEDLQWFRYSDGAQLRTIPVKVIKSGNDIYVPMRSALVAMGYLVAANGTSIRVVKPTPTPKPTAAPAAKPTATAQGTTAPSASTATVSPSATPDTTACNTQLNALKIENQRLKDQINQLNLQIQTLRQTQSFSGLSF